MNTQQSQAILEAEAVRLDNLRKALQHAISVGEKRHSMFGGARGMLVEQIDAIDDQIGAIKTALHQLSL